MKKLLWALSVCLVAFLPIGCGKKPDASASASSAATVSNTAKSKNPAPRETAQLALPNAATLLDAASLSTSVTQGTLDAVRARIDHLTEAADAAVTRIEQRPPTQAELIQLNALFDDTKRALMTDTQLAAQGLLLDPPARAAVARYTKRSHEQLMARLAAAGRRHRAQRKSK